MVQKKYNYFKTREAAERFKEEKQRKWHRAEVRKLVYSRDRWEYVVIWEAKKVSHGKKVKVKPHRRSGHKVEGYTRSYLKD